MPKYNKTHSLGTNITRCTQKYYSRGTKPHSVDPAKDKILDISGNNGAWTLHKYENLSSHAKLFYYA